MDANEQKPRIEIIVAAQARILLTPERVDAIRDAIQIMETHMEEHGTSYQERNVAILKEMIVGA